MASVRDLHVDEVIAALRRGPCTRAVLQQRTGLSRATVSGIVADLVAAGVANAQEAFDLRTSGAGRPARLVVLSEHSVRSVGVDFQIASVSVGIADPAHRVIAVATRQHRRGLNWRSRAQMAVEEIRALSARNKIDSFEPKGIGVGVPGPVPSGSADGPWRPAIGILSEEFCAPAYVENNLRLSTLGELIWGAGRGHESMVYFYLGEGIGGGIGFNGELYRGANGAAGEFGHITVADGGTRCRCGKTGCLEQVASVPAMLQRAGIRGGGRGIPELAAEPGLQAELSASAELCGGAVGDALTILDPSCLVVGGILAHAGNPVLDTFARAVRRKLLPTARVRLHVTRSLLLEAAGVQGGIALIQRDAGLAPPSSAPAPDPAGPAEVAAIAAVI